VWFFGGWVVATILAVQSSSTLLKPLSSGGFVIGASSLIVKWFVISLWEAFQPKQRMVLNTLLVDSLVEDHHVMVRVVRGVLRFSYRLCLDQILDTSELKVEGGWLGLSKINAPLKVQIYTSRVCGNIISTITLLRARGISCSLNCPWCVAHNETCYHVLLLCRRVLNAGARFIISLGPDWKTTSTCKLLSRYVLSYVSKTFQTGSTSTDDDVMQSLTK
jgi:hypothetical protein